MAHPKLPVLITATPSTEFLVGSQVKLRFDPDSGLGRIEGMKRDRYIVRWPTLNYLGRHSPDALILVATPPPKVNHYDRVLKRLDETTNANHNRQP